MWSVALVCTIHRDHCQVVLVNFLWLLVVLVRRAEKVASHLWPPSQNLSKWQVLTNVETQYKAMSKREAWSWHLSPTLQRLTQVTGGALLPSVLHHCPPTPPHQSVTNRDRKLIKILVNSEEAPRTIGHSSVIPHVPAQIPPPSV